MTIPFTQSCIRCKSKNKKDWCCPHYKECPYFENKYNVIINQFKDFTECIVYKYEFDLGLNPNLSDIDRSRKFEYNDKGVLVSKDPNYTISDLLDTLISSRKRTLDNVYGYALCNEWRYFFTLTFDPNKIKDRTDRDCVLYAWELFRKKMQYLFKDIKLFCVIENHELGGIHFHGFIGNANLAPYLVQGIDTKEYQYEYDFNKQCKVYKLDKNGNKKVNKHYLQPMTDSYTEKDTGIKHTIPVYIFKDNFFKYGYATLVELEKGTKTAHITSYLTKYFTKDQSSSIQYNKKAYFHTHNISFKEKTVKCLNENELQELVQGLDLKKDTDRFTVYNMSNDKYLEKQGLTYDPTINTDNIFGTVEQMKMDDIF